MKKLSKKISKFLAASAIAASCSMGSVFAADNPTCVLMKFTDDTRYDAIESAANLSDLVMEKMIASGKFNLKETRPLTENMEKLLYDEKSRELAGFNAAMKSGNFTPLFEGPGFSETKAQSIATASLGQVVTPSITKQIGDAHKADYLIQGTIINLGAGPWWSEDFAVMSQAINTASSVLGAPIACALSGALGPLGDIFAGGYYIKRTGVGVQSDIRIIKASTGEVVWQKRVLGISDQKQVSIGGFIKIGSAKLNANLYSKAMDKAASKIVDSLIADMDAKKLFLK